MNKEEAVKILQKEVKEKRQFSTTVLIKELLKNKENLDVVKKLIDPFEITEKKYKLDRKDLFKFISSDYFYYENAIKESLGENLIEALSDDDLEVLINKNWIEDKNFSNIWFFEKLVIKNKPKSARKFMLDFLNYAKETNNSVSNNKIYDFFAKINSFYIFDEHKELPTNIYNILNDFADEINKLNPFFKIEELEEKTENQKLNMCGTSLYDLMCFSIKMNDINLFDKLINKANNDEKSDLIAYPEDALFNNSVVDNTRMKDYFLKYKGGSSNKDSLLKNIVLNKRKDFFLKTKEVITDTFVTVNNADNALIYEYVGNLKDFLFSELFNTIMELTKRTKGEYMKEDSSEKRENEEKISFLLNMLDETEGDISDKMLEIMIKKDYFSYIFEFGSQKNINVLLKQCKKLKEKEFYFVKDISCSLKEAEVFLHFIDVCESEFKLKTEDKNSKFKHLIKDFSYENYNQVNFEKIFNMIKEKEKQTLRKDLLDDFISLLSNQYNLTQTLPIKNNKKNIRL